jgi:glycosyltransferase involved in cell wall biosynthesis
MSSTTTLSIVVPIHKIQSNLEIIRHTIRKSQIPAELIIVVNNPKLENIIKSENSNERIVNCIRQGRGYAFITGVQHATGDIIILLHADTSLPPDWSTAIIKVLQNERFVGGGFSLYFDKSNLFLKILIMLSRIRFHITGIIFGDRAIFARSKILNKCLLSMNVPIFEDMRLSQCMRRYGKTVLLKAYVKTSAESFHKRGILKHLWRIVKCQLWYALGGDLDRIYHYYYSN